MLFTDNIRISSLRWICVFSLPLSAFSKKKHCLFFFFSHPTTNRESPHIKWMRCQYHPVCMILTRAVIWGCPDGGDGRSSWGGVGPLSVSLYCWGRANKVILGVTILQNKHSERERKHCYRCCCCCTKHTIPTLSAQIKVLKKEKNNISHWVTSVLRTGTKTPRAWWHLPQVRAEWTRRCSC